MSKTRSDFRPRPPTPVAPPASPGALPHTRAAPRSDRARSHGPATDPRLDAALSFDNPVFPLDPPIEDVRIPVEAPHSDATNYSRIALRDRFPRAEVGNDLHMLFSEPGKAEQSRLAPDVFVALEVPRLGTRSEYDADRLGPPDFVLEVVSRSTWKHDVGRKLDCYQHIGVRECLLFNATGKDLPEVDRELWGFSLTPERREPLEEVALPNGERGVRSAVLGLVAYVAERTPPSGPGEVWALTMRWRDPATAADIPDYEQWRADEAQAEARAERARADAAQKEAQAERARAEAGQRKIAELEERLRRLRNGP